MRRLPLHQAMADDFPRLYEAIRRVLPGSDLRPLTLEKIGAVERADPGIPGHYLDFLRHVGGGDLGPGVFVFYDGPVAPASVFGPAAGPDLAGVRLFGGDFAGWCLGLDRRDGWRLAGVGSRGSSRPEGSATVAEFVSRLLAAEGPDIG